MKDESTFHDWIFNRPLFRSLRSRIMTMMMMLVLPVCIISMVLSFVSISQSIDRAYETGNNGFSLYMEQVALRYELGDIDISNNFPEELSPRLKHLYANAVGPDVGGSNGSSVYVTLGGKETFLINSNGTWESASQEFEKLRQAKYQFYWSEDETPFQVLVTFPYNFALRNVPVKNYIVIPVSLITLLLCPFLFSRLRHDILNPMDIMDNAMDSFEKDHSYRIAPQNDSISDDYLRIFSKFNDMAQAVQESYEKDYKLLQSEMDNLRLQVNPHMLLNSYNMIYSLAESKNYAVIQEYTLCLVDYFRYVLRRGQQMVTLRQELDFVQNFMHIQRIRFPNRFSYIYQVQDDCMDALIPPLLIENFVENAIKYALKPEESIDIVVSVHKESNGNDEEKLHISVTDTGSGICPEVLECLKSHEPYTDSAGQKHIGIYNCVRRIELFYGSKGDIHFTSGENQGTQAYMIIPCIYSEEVSK